MRKVHFVFIFISVFYQNAVGQLLTYPIEKNAGASARIEKTQQVDTILRLPFFDDFSKNGNDLDSIRWITNTGVTVENTFAINSPSLYSVIFDGVNGNGSPYSQDVTFNGPGDSLVSNSINLSRVQPSRRNTVYLSFFYQLRGLGEIPEETDSLQLSFLANDTTWVPIDINPESLDNYALTGGREGLTLNEDSVLSFRQIRVQINDARFYHQNFQFKLISYSSLAGIYDTWLVNYVYLNQERTETRLDYEDRTISSEPSPLFYPYNSIPVEAFNSNRDLYQTPQTVQLSNLEEGIYTIEFEHILRNLSTGEFVTSGPKNDDGEVGFRGIEYGREVSGISPFALPVTGDSVVIETEFIYNTGDTLLKETNSTGFDIYYDVDLKVNDTLRDYTTLHNYYAYDDGSAEFSAGINLLSGKLAVLYVIDPVDTLTGVDIYLPSINPSTVGQTLEVTVWSRLLDDENEISIRTQNLVIEQSMRNQFSRVEFVPPILVADSIFIGYQQFTDNYIGIGFDKNNNGGSDKIYYNTDRTWVQNDRIEGSLMIRPVFESGADLVLSVPEIENNENEIVLYPNPANNGILNIKGNYKSLSLMTVSGVEVLNVTGKKQINISNLPSGVYLTVLNTENGRTVKRIFVNNN